MTRQIADGPRRTSSDARDKHGREELLRCDIRVDPKRVRYLSQSQADCSLFHLGLRMVMWPGCSNLTHAIYPTHVLTHTQLQSVGPVSSYSLWLRMINPI